MVFSNEIVGTGFKKCNGLFLTYRAGYPDEGLVTPRAFPDRER